MKSLTYTQTGDYMLPNIRLKEQPDIPIGKYGLLRQTYLMNHRQIFYNNLVLKERLYPHLLEIDQTANIRLEQLMTELVTREPPPDKATNQMGWVAHMNTLKAQAEEFILTELIYC